MSVPQRQTKQRTAVAELLTDLDDFRSAQQIHDELRGRGESIGLTTVYRALQSLADAGEVDSITSDDGEAVYRKCSNVHHHHLVCRQCGKTVEITGPTVERWADEVASTHGFTEVSHTMELFGLCAQCSR
ncbi:MAG: transcriptional repressor [Candidatus Nanopelagicales bacterium]|nr:transcriptional repressor [Candidatus Nanopelagicales bacterium]